MQECKHIRESTVASKRTRLTLPVYPHFSVNLPRGYLKELTVSLNLTISYACVAALYRSTRKWTFDSDPALLHTRGLVLRRINKALQNPQMQITDETIIILKHMLFMDSFYASRAVIRAHLQGLHCIVQMRGGLGALGLDGDLAHMLKM